MRRALVDGVVLALAVACIVTGVLLISSMWLGTPDPYEIGLMR